MTHDMAARPRPGRLWFVALAVTALLAAALAAALVATGRMDAPAWVIGASEDEAGGGRPPTPVRVVSASRGVAEAAFVTSGRVRAAHDVALTVERPGRVAEVNVADGARVTEGAAILRLRDEDQRAARRASEARLAQAEADLARARELFAEDVAAEARVETAKAAARAARAQLAEAEAALADLTLRAPFAGRVGFVGPSRGAYLTPGDAVARLTSVGDLRIRFALPQRLADRVAPGATVAVRRDGAPCGDAEIVTLAPAMAAETRSREAEARAPAECGLRDGGFVAVSVPIETREDAVFAPQAAIRREGFEAWVYRVEQDEDGPVARRAPVTLGVVRDETVEILEGLSAGDRIVGDGAQRVTDGARIRPNDGGGA